MKSYYLSIVTQYDDEEEFYTGEIEAMDAFKDVIKDGYYGFDNKGNGKFYPVIEAQVKMTETSGGMIVSEEVIAEYRKYTTYAPDTDITFILVDYKEYHESSTEVIGFYYGEESPDSTETFSGETKATWRDVEYFF